MLPFPNWDQEIKCFQEVERWKPKLNLSFISSVMLKVCIDLLYKDSYSKGKLDG